MIGYPANLVFNTLTTSTALCSEYECLCTLKCPGGTFQDQTAQATCKDCLAGTYSTSGRSSCDYTINTCPKGTYANSATSSCDLCGIGEYNDLTGQTSEIACKSCSASQYYDNDLIGQTSDSYCKQCPPDREPTGDQLACVRIGEQAPVYESSYTLRTNGMCTDDGGISISQEACSTVGS